MSPYTSPKKFFKLPNSPAVAKKKLMITFSEGGNHDYNFFLSFRPSLIVIIVKFIHLKKTSNTIRRTYINLMELFFTLA